MIKNTFRTYRSHKGRIKKVSHSPIPKNHQDTNRSHRGHHFVIFPKRHAVWSHVLCKPTTFPSPAWLIWSRSTEIVKQSNIPAFKRLKTFKLPPAYFLITSPDLLGSAPGFARKLVNKNITNSQITCLWKHKTAGDLASTWTLSIYLNFAHISLSTDYAGKV